jgi:hypothetical protein
LKWKRSTMIAIVEHVVTRVRFVDWHVSRVLSRLAEAKRRRSFI